VRQPTDFLTLVRPPPEPIRQVGRWLGLPQPCVLPESISLTAEPTAMPAEPRREPSLAAAPFLVEFEEPEQLDPTRTDPIPDSPKPPIPRLAWWAMGGALALHSLVVVLIAVGTSKPPDLAPPIPISLVLERPPPEPPKPPAPPEPPALPEPPPPPGPIASVDMGSPTAPPGQTGTAPPKPIDAEIAPKPAEPPPPPPPPPKPTPPPEQVAAAAPPKPPRPPAPAGPRPATMAVPPRPHEPAHTGPRFAPVPGPSATRDEYLAYLVTLTKQHFDQVPLSLIGDRHGETSLSVIVLADGSIARISILRGSGYPEIDERIERMVAAVRRFPPLPQWYQGQSMDLVFRLRFPEGLRR
jgi:TonB family protein